MNTWAKRALGLGAAGLAAASAAVVVERRVVKARRLGAEAVEDYKALRSPAIEVKAGDGTLLHAEVDEIAPYASGARPDPRRPTVVFVHGYALNLDCWHFQRKAMRGRHRMVFYDQRSHGRSGRSPREHATIEQLGDDLATVIAELVPDGDVVLVGHSMGGMSIMTFAERHPEVFAERVRGVGLIATTAGGLRPHRALSPFIPDKLGDMVAPRLVTALANAPELVDSARARGSNIGFLVADRFAFGREAPATQVEFLDEMLAGTPIQVLAEFFPGFRTLNKFDVLGTFSTVPTTIICGTKDKLTSLGHSRKMAARIEGARLLEVPDAGHMVIFEAADLVNTALEQLFTAALRR
ncbi:alpha/beta hydrolase [Nocardioides mangrovicus]|uniref:Alpha/beta hydrolase n=1 Tax=Nocardioides mangrovicus TaxID=2478913 RepID=A0A3L8P5M6_9ACTN|nr:alpha/beta hydrolase [Nocardioides mangrovicus]RLV50690.1 alpha/beta hydrolase [Nocardioides mangrovicus]